MAQTRRYPNVLPSYMTSHNGTSERVEEREKAKIARMQNADPDGNKNPSYGSYPLFPSPRRVKEDDDGIKAIIKNVLGDFTDFKRIMNQEKNPGTTCIGVVPVPATPTESKTHYFGPENKPKQKEKQFANGLKETRIKEKTEYKSKPSLELSKQKVLKPSKKATATDHKLKDQKARDSGEMKGLQTKENSSSNDKTKNSQTTGLLCNKNETNLSSGCSSRTKVSDDILATNTQSQEIISTTTTSIKKSEESSETAIQQSTNTELKMEPSAVVATSKSRPTPIQIPSRNDSLSSDIKSPHHSDMKVLNILKEMTEPNVPPLTGLCTPVPSKVGCRFPFPSNLVEKDVSGDLGKEDSLHTDLVLSDSDVEQNNGAVPDTSGRIDDHSSSSSSSSSSSDESDSSSDSDNEEPSNHQTWSNVPKQTQLNAISPPVASPTVCSAISTPKNNHSENLTGIEEPSTKRTSPSGTTNSEKILENLPMGLNNCHNTRLPGPEPFVVSVKQITVGTGQEQSSLHESSQRDNKEKSKTNVEISRDEPLALKIKTEINEQETTKGNAVGDPEHGKSKSLKIGISKLKNELNEVTKQKKPKKRREDKAGGLPAKNIVTKVKSEDLKKSKVSEKGVLAKKRLETPPSKNTNFTKTIKKEVKDVRKKDLLHSDTNSDDAEDSVIDVVGDESPVIKEKRRRLDSSSKDNPSDINGRTKNKQHDMPLDIQVVRDDDKELKSLVVRIDLSLLKRIPKKALENNKISVVSAPAGIEVSSVTNNEKRSTHPEKSAAEQKTEKKEPYDDSGEKSAEQISSERRRHSGSYNGYTKRSPSWGKDYHPKKRIRRDTDREKGTTTHKNDRHRSRKSMAEQNAEVEEDIKKVNPDTHLQQAKTLKREADKLTDKEAKSKTYVEAIIRFICCGKALEDKEETEQRASQMYYETTELLRFILKHVLGKSDDKRLLIVCLRIQSLLLHKLYRMKNKQAIRNSQTLAEYFKATHKTNITSPYPANNKHGSTPSPMSPTPSPAGSVGSIGSSGSNSSGEGNPTSSLNGRHLPFTSGANSSVMSPVSVSIPQRIHTVMSQHVSTTSKLVHSVDIWEKADNLMSDYQEFFSTMDSICGALTFHSSIAHVVNYVKKCLSKLHDFGKES